MALNTEVFLDTSFAIALVSRRDALHVRAREIRRAIEADARSLVTSHAVLMEFANFLASPPNRGAAVELIEAILQDASTTVVPLSPELFERAFELYASRSDKSWSLTDCLSFTIMRERGIVDALTADDHFHQAGFRALLRS